MCTVYIVYKSFFEKEFSMKEKEIQKNLFDSGMVLIPSVKISIKFQLDANIFILKQLSPSIHLFISACRFWLAFVALN